MAAQQQEASAQVDLVEASSQSLVVEVIGDGARLIEGNAKNVTDPDEIMPDWCALLVKAANLGMMSGAGAPWTSGGSISKSVFDPALRLHSWRLNLTNTDPGVFLVLLNLLRARDLEAFTVRTIEPRVGRPLQVGALTYPGRFSSVPFQVDVEPSLRSSKERYLQLVFAQPPGVALQKDVMGAVDVWSNILILAGYTARGRDPRRSFTLPDVPYWYDEVTFMQSFEEAFDADDSAFNALVNWVSGLHLAGHAVDRVILH